MQIKDESEFPKLREQLKLWRKRFTMFSHDVNQIEKIIELHIQYHSIAMVFHRQTRSKKYLEDAEKEIQKINQVIATVEKLELMAMLSQS